MSFVSAALSAAFKKLNVGFIQWICDAVHTVQYSTNTLLDVLIHSYSLFAGNKRNVTFEKKMMVLIYKTY